MYALWISSAIWLAAAGAAQSDVFYEEEVVNSGMGSKKIGARKTVNQVYIKGLRQRVHSEIKATKKNLKALSKQGTPVDASTILQLDRSKVLEIDHEQAIYSTRRLPARNTTRNARFHAVGQSPNGRQADCRTEEGQRQGDLFSHPRPADTSRIDGILCKRVAAELVARHYEPGTKKLRRENRYLYQAWMATEFDGYEENKEIQRASSEENLLSARRQRRSRTTGELGR